MSIPLAEVVLGKGGLPEGLTQNGGGLPTLTNQRDQTKTTNGTRSAGTDLGNIW